MCAEKARRYCCLKVIEHHKVIVVLGAKVTAVVRRTHLVTVASESAFSGSR